ncbi:MULTISPECIES: FmdE family protein [Desulfosediminicola]|uniref:FmdE family protein n=1 Tax=Desulfosediminicola TaxID=2886823 RepID=UPI0010ACBC47|nr:FmdE family protein [Desulfosediminicola ganghwensis]
MTIFSKETIEGLIAFHGHSCPGLAIGIRAAEYAKRELPKADSASLICVTETDMCGVDAIQFLCGCTFGKGNLIHRDYGKMAFTFYDREQGTGFRIVLTGGVASSKDSRKSGKGNVSELMAKDKEGTITAEEKELLSEMREMSRKQLMEAPLDDLFTKTELNVPPPSPARVLAGLVCESCGEKTMESRTRRFGGQTLCIPCFDKVEQKV